MARKSRRKNQVSPQNENVTKSYKAGIYARISVADGEIESSSIQNQILIAKKFLDEQKDIVLQEIYIDEGKTGTNFERPAFLELIEDAKERKINCIIVKDFSRFGRNYLGVGGYLENDFPQQNVRFISVNDHFDSEKRKKEDDFILPLKGIVNDSYAKDISKKVSTAIAVKKGEGKFMGGKPPYGYHCSPEEKHRLEVVEGQAEVVRKIYAWRLDGLGVAAIAKRLNDLEVPSWQRLRFLEGTAGGRKDALWRGASVMGILKNPCYLGCLVERKTEQALYKGGIKKVLPKENWNMINNTHQPIISREVFDQVQTSFPISESGKRDLPLKNEGVERKENIFRGQIRCGICGGRMQKSSGYFVKNNLKKQYAFYCPKKYLKSGECKISSVEEHKLREIFILLCNIQAELFLGEGHRDRWAQVCQMKGDSAFDFLIEEGCFQIIVNPDHICFRLQKNIYSS